MIIDTSDRNFNFNTSLNLYANETKFGLQFYYYAEQSLVPSAPRFGHETADDILTNLYRFGHETADTILTNLYRFEHETADAILTNLYRFYHVLKVNAKLVKSEQKRSKHGTRQEEQKFSEIILKSSDSIKVCDSSWYIIRIPCWTLSIHLIYTTFRELALLPSSGDRLSLN
jgi:hypothetical protein